MICDRCGVPLVGTETFCPQCGTELRRGAAPQPEGEETSAPGPAHRSRRKRRRRDDETELAARDAAAKRPTGPAAVESIDVPLQPPAGASPEPEVVEAVDVPLDTPLDDLTEPDGTAIPEVPFAGPMPEPLRLQGAGQHQARLVGPLGLGLATGCLLFFILGLGALGVYQGRQMRIQRQYQEATGHYERGLAHLQQGEYELAIAELEYALRLRPNYPEAQQKLAEARAKASEQPSPAPPGSNAESSSLLAEGRAAYERGAWDEAIQRLEALQAGDPNYEQDAVRRLLAAAYANSGLKLVSEARLEEAIRRFEQALTLQPDNPDIQLQSRLATLYQEGLSAWGVNWNEAITDLSTVYALKPDYQDAAERLQRAYVEAGNAAGGQAAWCDAVQYYKSALDLSSTPELAAKRDDAAHRCASPTSAPGGTPVPSGTFVGAFAGLVDNTKRTHEWAEVRGQVVNAEGKGVPNAQVRLSAFDWTSNIHTADGDGYYRIEFLNNEITFTVTLVGVAVQPVDVPTKFGYAAVANFREVR